MAALRQELGRAAQQQRQLAAGLPWHVQCKEVGTAGVGRGCDRLGFGVLAPLPSLPTYVGRPSSPLPSPPWTRLGLGLSQPTILSPTSQIQKINLPIPTLANFDSLIPSLVKRDITIVIHLTCSMPMYESTLSTGPITQLKFWMEYRDLL